MAKKKEKKEAKPLTLNELNKQSREAYAKRKLKEAK